MSLIIYTTSFIKKGNAKFLATGLTVFNPTSLYNMSFASWCTIERNQKHSTGGLYTFYYKGDFLYMIYFKINVYAHTPML